MAAEQRFHLYLSNHFPTIYIELSSLKNEHVSSRRGRTRPSTMSKEDDDERRLNQCLSKYRIIVKQFDELGDIMEARSRTPKRQRGAKGNGSSSASTSTTQPDNNEAFVQTISRFLQELRFNPDCSSSNPPPRIE